jgi:hypothetical protein
LAAACAAAFLVPVVAAGGLLSLDGTPSTRASIFLFSLFLGLPIAFLHLLFLALPAYAILSRHWRLRWWSAASGGFVVGVTPIGLLALGLSAGPSDATTLPLEAGLLGLAGGVAFWAALTIGKGGPLPDRPSSD